VKHPAPPARETSPPHESEPEPYSIPEDQEEPEPEAPTEPEEQPNKHSNDKSFCSTHECIGKYGEEPGTVVECSDGTYSHAGGIQGACSHHGER
jgi:hypothetical protein